MIPELGHFALTLALPVAALLGYLGLMGAHRMDARWMAFVRPATLALFGLVVVSFACLTWAFYNNDFSVLYVVQHSNSKLPTLYRISGVWGGHEGSLLLWLLMLTVWMAGVAMFSRTLPDAMVARVLGVLGLVGIGFMLFMLITSNPFLRLAEAAADGRDLNPLLQDPGLVFHPPMLYMGYVGMAIPYAFAVAALLGGRLDAAWARWSRPWTTAAWIFLTLGIALGSWWAYYELGWGGWWFWDPVENASFMPWLVGTALIHSLAVTEKRGLFRNWTLILAITAFSLSLLGTFLVRSGVLTSVHAFATDPRRGVFILLFLTAVVGSSLVLFALRAARVRVSGQFAIVSRETLLLLNNVLLTTAAASVLLGTLYPLVVDALQLGKISVGAPYFNAVFAPLMVPVLVFMIVGIYTRWKQDEGPALWRQMRVAALVSVVAGCALPLWAGTWTPLVSLGLGLALWVVLGSALHIVQRLRQTRGGQRQPWSYWGMHLAHIGVAVSVVGVTMVKGFETERDVRMSLGDTVNVGGYTFKLTQIGSQPGPNYNASVGTVEVTRNGQPVTVLQPEKRQYFSSAMPMTEAAIQSNPLRDLYVSLGEQINDSAKPAWAVRVYHKPFVTWIWVGCLIMALGGGIAAADKRYRKRVAARTTQKVLGAEVAA